MRTLNDIFNITDLKTTSPYLFDAYSDSVLGNEEDVCEDIHDLIFDELKKLSIKDETYTTFRFSSFPFNEKNMDTDPVISDIKSDSITFSNPSKFNDPMDPLLRVWLQLQVDNKKKGIGRTMFKLMKETVEQIRISCMACPKIHSLILSCSSLMWAHYANGHKGVCLQYEITPEIIRNHNSEDCVLRMDRVRCRGEKTMSSNITLDNALLAKASDWKYEDEIRLMYFTKNHPVDEKGKKKDYITLSGFPIKAVYMGCRINRRREDYIKTICKDRNLPLYKMAFSMDDITKLEVKKVDLIL